MIEYSKRQIKKSDLDRLFQSVSDLENTDFVKIPLVTNNWLFLYLLKKYRVYFHRLYFRGGLGKKNLTVALLLSEDLDVHFNVKEDLTHTKLILKTILTKNVPDTVNCSYVNKYLDRLRTHAVFWQNKYFADNFLNCFEYDLITKKEEFDRIRKDLQSFELDDESKWEDHVRRVGDIQINPDLVIKNNPIKALLHDQFYKDFYLKSERLEPLEANILGYLFLDRKQKGLNSNKQLAENFRRSIGGIKNAISSLNTKSRRLLSDDIICTNELDDKYVNQKFLTKGKETQIQSPPL